MARTKEEIISEMVDSGLFTDEEIINAVKSNKQSSSPQQKGSDRFGRPLGYATDVLEGMALPAEIVGEAIRVPIEQGDGFRAPSIVQRNFPSTRTEEPPSFMGVDVANKLLRAGAAYAAGLPKGTDEAKNMALAAYNADRGIPGVVEDTSLMLLLGKLNPELMNAPYKVAGEALKDTGKALKVTGKLMKGGSRQILKKGIRIGTGVSEEAQSARFRRPSDLINAKNEVELAKDIERGHRIVDSRISSIENQVSDVVRKSPYLNEGAVPKDDILKIVNNQIKKMGRAITQKDEYAKTILKNIKERLNGMRNTVSEAEQRHIIQSLDDAIPYGKQTYGNADIRLMGLRKSIDRGLKKSNEAYRDLMKQEVPLQRLKKDLVDKFGLKRSVGEGFIATDTTASKIKTILGDTKEVQSQKILNKLKNVTGQDYLKQAKDFKMAKEFKASAKTSGFMRGGAGGAMGMILEPFVPGPQGIPTALGIGAGTAANYYAGPIAGGTIDAVRGGSNVISKLLNSIKQTSTPLQAIIQQASQNQPILAPLSYLGTR